MNELQVRDPNCYNSAEIKFNKQQQYQNTLKQQTMELLSQPETKSSQHLGMTFLGFLIPEIQRISLNKNDTCTVNQQT